MKETATGSKLIGMQSLFDSNVLENQVRSAREFGAERIFFLSMNMSGSLLQYVDALNQQGVAAEIIRSGSELVPYAAKEGLVLYLSDGMLPGQSFEERFKSQYDNVIYVVENADVFEAYERIDLEHRWLGIAVLKAAYLENLAAIPEDWDVGSALLRTAVQSHVPRETIVDDELMSGGVAHLTSQTAIEQFTHQKLADSVPRRGGILERLVLWPLMKRTLKPLWKNNQSAGYLGAFTIVSAMFAGVAAYFQWPVLSIFLLILAYFAIRQRDAIALFSHKKKETKRSFQLFAAMTAIVLLILVVTMSPTLSILPNIVIALSLLMLLGLYKKEHKTSRLWIFYPDLLFVFLILLIAAAFGQIFVGFSVSLLWVSGFLLIQSLVSDSDPEK